MNKTTQALEPELPELPKYLVAIDQNDDEFWGEIQEHAWDSDYVHVGPENPWKETANAFPVYAAPVSAGLSDEEKSNLQELIRYLEAVDAHAQADTVRALAARLRLPEGWVAVPLDPSPEMVEMGVKEMFGAAFTSEGEEATRVYRAMIAAAHNEVQDKPMPGQQEE